MNDCAYIESKYHKISALYTDLAGDLNPGTPRAHQIMETAEGNLIPGEKGSAR